MTRETELAAALADAQRAMEIVHRDLLARAEPDGTVAIGNSALIALECGIDRAAAALATQAPDRFGLGIRCKTCGGTGLATLSGCDHYGRQACADCGGNGFIIEATQAPPEPAGERGGNRQKILDGLQDAIRGNFTRVTINGETWVKQTTPPQPLDGVTEENRKLSAFAVKIMEDWQEGGQFDGADIQDIAAASGLLVETTMQQPCGATSDECDCLEYCDRDEWPLQCYRVSDTLKRARALHAAKGNSDG